MAFSFRDGSIKSFNTLNPFRSILSSTALASRYLRYWLTAQNGKGHGIHSPFVFDFVCRVLNDCQPKPCYRPIESCRKELLQRTDEIEVMDFGAGSGVLKSAKRKVKDMAASSLKSPKYAQLLHRIVSCYQPNRMLELGTSFGITTLYLAEGNKNGKIDTFEGDSSICDIAIRQAQKNGITNITHHIGEFNHTLTSHLQQLSGHIDLAFIDGNHRKEPTLQYFHQLLPHINEDSIMIFDDIYWSKEMQEAWQFIGRSEAVTLSIDLFFIGIVFFKKDFKAKQHFRIRF